MKSAFAVIDQLVGPLPAEFTVGWLEALATAAESKKCNGSSVLPELYWIAENAARCATWMRTKNVDAVAFIGPFRLNPFMRGQTVIVPKGTKVEHRGQVRETRRANRVVLASVDEGYTHDDRGPIVASPRIIWAGSGGYWSTVDLCLNPHIAIPNESTPAGPHKSESHYAYLDAHLRAFFERLGVAWNTCAGIVSAHGDKFYGYRTAFESAGIPFAQGVAIGLLSYVRPFCDETRQTQSGWVPVEDWVVANKERFLPLLPPIG